MELSKTALAMGALVPAGGQGMVLAHVHLFHVWIYMSTSHPAFSQVTNKFFTTPYDSLQLLSSYVKS